MLAKFSSVGAIRFLQNKYNHEMKPAHLAYLNAPNDKEQFPAAWCKMAHDSLFPICMYGKTASSGVGSMNQANNNVRR